MRRNLSIVVAVCAIAALLGACSSGKKSAPPSAPVTSGGTSTPASSTSAAPASPSGGLSRSAFVATANAMCANEEAQLTAAAKGANSLATIPSFVDTTISILTAAVPRFTQMIAAQPDRATLEANWLTPRFADYRTYEQALTTLKGDAQRGDTAAAQAELAAIPKLPSHDSTVKPFLTSYGLTACA